MASKTPPPSAEENKKPVTIKLSEVATTYIESLQRLFDLSAMILGSTRLINESQYDEFSKSMGVMPANQKRMSYDAAKEETERWVLKHILSEGLGACMLAMSDCRTICALTRWKAAGEKDQEEVKKILGPDKQDFDLMPMSEKFAFMSKEFGVDSQFVEHLDRLIKLRQCLVSRGGKVTEDEAVDSGSLVLKLKSVQLQTSPIDANDLSSMRVSTQLSDLEIKLPVGERIRLGKNEQVAIIITLAFFITNLMEGVQTFGKAQGLPDAR